MGMMNGFVKRLPKWLLTVFVIVIILFVLFTMVRIVSAAIRVYAGQEKVKELTSQAGAEREQLNSEDQTVQQLEKFAVEFIDVGQADCILVTDGSSTMLIDAGNNADGPLVVDYLKDKGIDTIDALVGTHPHEDHIGGMDDIIENFNVVTLYMPDVTATTKTFEDVLEAADDKGLSITIPSVNDVWSLGPAECKVLSCEAVNDATDLNEWSIVIKMTYGEVSFLFTGDIDSANESAMLASGVDLSATVLKAAHHGSRTANTKAFLQQVSAQYSVISVGADNSYGHPHIEAYTRLGTYCGNVYCTSEYGTVGFITDGITCTIYTNFTYTNAEG